MRKLLIGVAVVVICVSCKLNQESRSETKTLYTAEILTSISDFENAGKCTVIDLLISGELKGPEIKGFVQSAQSRVTKSEEIWQAVAKARVKRGSHFQAAFGLANGLQTRGYIEPVFLADIKAGIPFTGKNEMDVFQDLATKTKDEATSFGRTIF